MAENDKRTEKASNDEGVKKETKKEDDLANEISKLTLTDKTEDEHNDNNGNKRTAIPPEIQDVADWIKSSKRIMVLSGAGVSVAAGIPDFRTPGTGLYDNLQEYNLPYPEAVFELDFFRQNPQPFLRLAKEIWPGLIHSPTLTHSFLCLLHKKQQRLLRVYSQNIDGLEFLAGLPAEKIVECHGHFRTVTCIECFSPVKDVQAYRDAVVNGNNDSASSPPVCEYCGGHVKPDIVFFGEQLPDRFHNLLTVDVPKADLLLVMGTSLQVAPVSMIPHYVNCKRVLVNRDEVGEFDFDSKKKKDIFLQGNCDDTIMLLAKALGWEDELTELHRESKVNKE